MTLSATTLHPSFHTPPFNASWTSLIHHIHSPPDSSLHFCLSVSKERRILVTSLARFRIPLSFPFCGRKIKSTASAMDYLNWLIKWLLKHLQLHQKRQWHIKCGKRRIISCRIFRRNHVQMDFRFGKEGDLFPGNTRRMRISHTLCLRRNIGNSTRILLKVGLSSNKCRWIKLGLVIGGSTSLLWMITAEVAVLKVEERRVVRPSSDCTDQSSGLSLLFGCMTLE